ncbi:uncharacterized protein LOC115966843 [Quercus lobata]|uniref:Uncharacterized protein n=1 Tax=Quercus lobata TaxID=97700 RepID=A0A7N2MYQ2_QUELO|nr:uncharacterized protein LOC115966843 [Quercus lobata]
MGICASSQYTGQGGIALKWPSTVKIIHLDGTLQELKHSIKAEQILSQNLGCFLCSSESMYINSHIPFIPQNEELKLGQIYFLMPLSKSHQTLSLQDLCTLAIKAHAALTHSEPSTTRTSKLSNNFCTTPAGVNIVGLSSTLR